MGQANGRRSGVALPEHEEARLHEEQARSMIRERIHAEFRAQVQRVAGQVVTGLVSRPSVSIDGVTEREDLADDAIALARAIVVRSLGVAFPSEQEIEEAKSSRARAAQNQDANEKRGEMTYPKCNTPSHDNGDGLCHQEH